MQGVAGARMAAPRRHVDSVSLLHVVPHAAARRFACKEQKARPLREAAAGPPSRRAGPGGMVGPFCQTRTGTEANKTVNEIFAFFFELKRRMCHACDCGAMVEAKCE